MAVDLSGCSFSLDLLLHYLLSKRSEARVEDVDACWSMAVKAGVGCGEASQVSVMYADASMRRAMALQCLCDGVLAMPGWCYDESSLRAPW